MKHLLKIENQFADAILSGEKPLRLGIMTGDFKKGTLAASQPHTWTISQ